VENLSTSARSREICRTIYQKQARKLPLQARKEQSPAVSGR